jgi:hypothetical protein
VSPNVSSSFQTFERRVTRVKLAAAALILGLSGSGCVTYTVYARSYSDGPKGETMGTLLGVEAAVGAAVAAGTVIRFRHDGPWYQNAIIGFVLPFVVDLAIAFGIGTSDFVGE